MPIWIADLLGQFLLVGFDEKLYVLLLARSQSYATFAFADSRQPTAEVRHEALITAVFFLFVTDAWPPRVVL